MTRTAKAMAVVGSVALSGCLPRASETSGQVEVLTTETTETTTPTTAPTMTTESETTESETTGSETTTEDPGCMLDEDCMGGTPVCDEDSNTCVVCTSESGCEQGTVCQNMTECVDCVDDSNCPCINNECVACKVSADCIGNTNGEVCNADNECVACTADNDSACSNENKYCSSEYACEHPESCSDLRDWGYTADGLYWLNFCDDTLKEFECALDPNGPKQDFGVGWTKVTWPDVWGCAHQMEAVDEGTSSGVHDVAGPFATHNGLAEPKDPTFSYHFTFSVPTYSAFFFEDYTVSFSVCEPDPCYIDATGQQQWEDNAYSGSGGTIIFGSEAELALNIAEKTDGEDQSYGPKYYPQGDPLILNSTANAQGDQLGITTLQPATAFRIAWGEHGVNQIERIDVWDDGAIWFRRTP